MPRGGGGSARGLCSTAKSQKLGELIGQCSRARHSVLSDTVVHSSLSICVLTLTEHQVFTECNANSRGELQDRSRLFSGIPCRSVIGL